ncbi:MAG: DUF1653 domain-containing protein [Paludibacteraceae bacterium]|nr:DUF1653 domain-containing protein [Paludibacteraceae bacterium]
MAQHNYYRHFKGGEYELLAIAQESETKEKVVVYKALYGDNLVWVRPYNMFFSNVIVDGKECPRFAKINKSEVCAL